MYESYFPKYNSELVGVPIISKLDYVLIQINYPNFGIGYQFDGENLRAGYATGRWGVLDGRNIIQVLVEFGEYSYGWVFADECTYGKAGKASKSAVEKLLNQILSNNQQIVVNNLLSAHLVKLIEARGKSVPSEVKNGIRELQTRVNERDTKIANCEWITGRKVGTPTGAKNYSSDLSALMGANVGLVVTISVTTIILLSALVTGIIAVLLYSAFSESGKMSVNDYKASKKYLEVLSKLSPEDKEIVEKEMTKALNYGFKIGGNTNLKNIGLMAAGIGIFFAAKPVASRLGITDKK